MSDKEQFDFWYAVNNTEVLLAPSRRLETFGTTVVNYHLVSELMDSVERVRVREGRMEAARPEIITPQALMETPLEGFGEEAHDYIQWLREHAQSLRMLKYGFNIRKREQNEYVVSDNLHAVAARVRQALQEKADPLSALAVGVDKPWEVCLLKVMVDLVENSISGNVRELEAKDLFNRALDDPGGAHAQIEAAFRAATRNRSQIAALARLLEKHHLFKEYEDRFFALVQGRK